ncbi:uncharacterized protein EV154DRAFT_478348 [Mucor mucedo]|uniref:uncharacterized protein n=1 Tax=Mucor mucedo TaxID=29922 RepID=UPI00221EA608|nr:uncharacterized protein EV154DRAFT_478348 [Mucor mucedo]KAI7894370.1 hypothetical protein EV154DRAFT_478348 [Mucor mucedo]
MSSMGPEYYNDNGATLSSNLEYFAKPYDEALEFLLLMLDPTYELVEEPLPKRGERTCCETGQYADFQYKLLFINSLAWDILLVSEACFLNVGIARVISKEADESVSNEKPSLIFHSLGSLYRAILIIEVYKMPTIEQFGLYTRFIILKKNVDDIIREGFYMFSFWATSFFAAYNVFLSLLLIPKLYDLHQDILEMKCAAVM